MKTSIASIATIKGAVLIKWHGTYILTQPNTQPTMNRKARRAIEQACKGEK